MDKIATTVVAPDKPQAIEALKKKLADRACPTLALAGELQESLDRFRISKEELASDTGTNRPHISLVISTLKWEPDVRANLERLCLSDREIQALNRLPNAALLLQVSQEAKEAKIALGRIYKRCEDLCPQTDTPGPVIKGAGAAAAGTHAPADATVISKKTVITPDNGPVISEKTLITLPPATGTGTTPSAAPDVISNKTVITPDNKNVISEKTLITPSPGTGTGPTPLAEPDVISKKTVITPNNRQKEQYNADNTPDNIPSSGVPGSFAALLASAVKDLLGRVAGWMSPETQARAEELTKTMATGGFRPGNRLRFIGRFFLWSLAIYGAMGLAGRGASWLFRRATPQSALFNTVQQVPAFSVQAPLITARYVAGHKIRLEWASIGPGYTYKVLVAPKYDPGRQPQYQEVIPGKVIETPGAIVDLHYFGPGDNMPLLAVMAISPEGNESKPSNAFQAELTISNRTRSVEPLGAAPAAVAPSEGAVAKPKGSDPTATSTRGQTPSQAPSAIAPPVQKPTFMNSFAKQLLNNADGVVRSVIPVPLAGSAVVATKNAAVKAAVDTAPAAPSPATVPRPSGVSARVVSPTEIWVSWKDIGNGHTYNAYSDTAQEMKNPFKENASPMHRSSVKWTPERGFDAYWLSVTAVSPAGTESYLSDPIYVKVR